MMTMMMMMMMMIVMMMMIGIMMMMMIGIVMMTLKDELVSIVIVIDLLHVDTLDIVSDDRANVPITVDVGRTVGDDVDGADVGDGSHVDLALYRLHDTADLVTVVHATLATGIDTLLSWIDDDDDDDDVGDDDDDGDDDGDDDDYDDDDDADDDSDDDAKRRRSI